MGYERGQNAAAAAAPGVVAPGSTYAPGMNAGGGGGRLVSNATTTYNGETPQTSVVDNGAAGLRHPASKPAWGREHFPGPAPNTAGPHRFDILNKLDPRVDSNMSNPRTIHAYAVANPGTMPGPAPTTAGPHRSDLLNKLDPRVDSDLSSLGGNPPTNRMRTVGAHHQQGHVQGGVAQEPPTATYHRLHSTVATEAAPPTPPMYAEPTPNSAAGPHSTTFPSRAVGTHRDVPHPAPPPPPATNSDEAAFPSAAAPTTGLGNQSDYSDYRGAQGFGNNYSYSRPEDSYYRSQHSRPINPLGSDARFDDSNRPGAAHYYCPPQTMSGGAGPPSSGRETAGRGGGFQYPVPPTAGTGAATSDYGTRPPGPY